MAVVYIHRKKTNDQIFYVGIGKRRKRVFSFANRNSYWHNIVKKHGFEAEIILENLTWEEAKEAEKFLINFLGRSDLKEGLLCNLTNGGEGVQGVIRSKGFIENMRIRTSSQSLGRRWFNDGERDYFIYPENIPKGLVRGRITKGKKRKPFTKETKNKISKSKEGNIPWNKGKKMKDGYISKETAQRISLSNKGRIWINNGIVNKKSLIENIPDGFVVGRLVNYKRRTKKEILEQKKA